MSNPYNNLDTRLIELVLKYDDPDPKERKAMEEYLSSVKAQKPVNKQIKKVKPAVKPFRKVRPASTPMNIDISLPPELTKMLKEGQ